MNSVTTYYDDIPLDDESVGGQWDYVEPQPYEQVPEWPDRADREPLPQAPQRIRELRALQNRNPWSITRNKAFYEQAVMMADYSDHAEIVPFQCYFPTYREMSVDQLRSYFSIRLMLRQGKVPQAPTSYFFVYIYELLMKVGCLSAEDALGRLEELRENCRTSVPRLENYLAHWLRDFVVYNNLSQHFADYFAEELRWDKLASIIANRDKVSDGLLFEAVTQLATYKITGAALYKKHKRETEAVVARAVRAVAPVYEAMSHHRFETLCTGLRKKAAHPMFAGAVFYDPQPVRSAEIAITPRRKFICTGGTWTETVYQQRLMPAVGGPLSDILHETDRQLRFVLGVKPALKPRLAFQKASDAIHSAIMQWKEEEEEAQRPKVTIDLSKLSRIREDAAAVRDALLTDEEKAPDSRKPDSAETKPLSEVSTTPSPQHTERQSRYGATAMPQHAERQPRYGVAPIPQHTAPQNGAESTPEAPQNDGTGAVFSPEEQTFLRLLLDGKDYGAYLREIHTPAGVMTDAINTKTMDLDDIGDMVIEDNGDGPAIIGDYRDDVIRLLKA